VKDAVNGVGGVIAVALQRLWDDSLHSGSAPKNKSALKSPTAAADVSGLRRQANIVILLAIRRRHRLVLTVSPTIS